MEGYPCLRINHSASRGLGIVATKGYSASKGECIGSYGPVVPFLFSTVRRKIRAWVNYCNIIEPAVALAHKLRLRYLPLNAPGYSCDCLLCLAQIKKGGPLIDHWVLIPASQTKDHYIHGGILRRGKRPDTDAIGINATHRGMLYNTVLGNKSSDVFWKVHGPVDGGPWAVKFYARRKILVKKEFIDLYSDYGPSFKSFIEEQEAKATVKKSRGFGIKAVTKSNKALMSIKQVMENARASKRKM
jgi:hypothetical protein